MSFFPLLGAEELDEAAAAAADVVASPPPRDRLNEVLDPDGIDPMAVAVGMDDDGAAADVEKADATGAVGWGIRGTGGSGGGAPGGRGGGNGGC